MIDELENDLRRIAAEADPMPALVRESAHAAFGLRRLDAELAELVRDSAEAQAVGVRGDEERLLSFEYGEVAVEMQVGAVGERRDLVAHVSGAALAAAAVETPSTREDLDTDDGVLVAHGLPAGPFRLALTTAAGRRIQTSWVCL